MAKFELELSKAMKELQKQLVETQEAFDKGSRKGMEKAVALWERESKKLAPQDKRSGSNAELRESIQGEVRGQRVSTVQGKLTAEAWNSGGNRPKWRPFNYAYYLHEIYPKKYGTSFKNPSQMGTVPQFLDKPLQNEGFKKKLLEKIEQEILDEVERRGW